MEGAVTTTVNRLDVDGLLESLFFPGRFAASSAAGPGQSLQHYRPALEHLVAGRVRKAKVRVAVAEDAAGNDQQFVGDRLGDKLASPVPHGARGNM